MDRHVDEVSTNGPISIRAMQATDYDRVRCLWEASDGVMLHEPSDSRSQIAFYLQRNPGLSLVAESGTQLIAAVLCGHDGRRGYLSHLAVAPEFRQRGLGTRLVNLCLSNLCEAGVPGCNIRLALENGRGRQFWERLDWKKLPVEVLISPDRP